MRVYPFDRAEPGEFLDPRPLNRELRNLVQRANHLDRWAIAADLPPARIRPDAFNVFGRWIQTVAQTVQVAPPTYAYGTSEFAPSTQLVAVPDNSGDPWVEELDAADGLLHIRLLTDVGTDGHPGAFYRLGVQVNGRLALGPMVLGQALGDALMLDAMMPVGAGLVRLAPVALVSVGIGVDGLGLSAVGTFDLTFNTRTLAVREAVR